MHRSNFEIVGFTESPSIDELVAVGAKTQAAVAVRRRERPRRRPRAVRFRSAPTIRELIAAGVDAITCSTDKLIGATQGGLIVGSEDIIDRCRKHPLMRALRAGKESYAVIAETLRAFATGRTGDGDSDLPDAGHAARRLRAAPRKMVRNNCRVIESHCALGGGTTPTETIPSIAIEVPGDASQLAARFL